MAVMTRALLVVVLCANCAGTHAGETDYSYFETGDKQLVPLTVEDTSIDEPEVVCEHCAAEQCRCVGKRYRMDRAVRAGCAHQVAWWATSGTNNRNYAAGYVGGGAVVNGDGPHPYYDGTWGLDYVGIVIPKRVFLNWWHGRKHQGGVGAYKTDGPKIKHE